LRGKKWRAWNDITKEKAPSKRKKETNEKMEIIEKTRGKRERGVTLSPKQINRRDFLLIEFGWHREEEPQGGRAKGLDHARGVGGRGARGRVLKKSGTWNPEECKGTKSATTSERGSRPRVRRGTQKTTRKK